MKLSRLQYALVLALYVTVWVAAFSRLTGGPYLALGLAVALGYGAGQAIALLWRQHIALSADPVALPAAAAVALLGTWLGMSRGFFQPDITSYLEIVERFLTAFLLGHLVVLLLAAAMDKIATAARWRRM
jgi:hypothetical protein